MIKTFTKNDLLLYAYGEISEKSAKGIENALLCDQDLQDEYREILQAINSLNSVASLPSDKAVKNILNYSKSFKLPSAVK